MNPIDGRTQLDFCGYFLLPLSLPAKLGEATRDRDWPRVDALAREQTLPGGVVYEALRPYAEFTQIEFILSIRPGLDLPPGDLDEDGIWHDDGSRVLAFSLSLTQHPESLVGGRLGIRRRALEDPDAGPDTLLPTPPFGTMIVFATGLAGYEHRIHRVERGERVIIAGWCT